MNIEVKRNTVQKEVIERIVLSACDHPNADSVYQRARAELPNISLGTVYRILKQLAADGVILEIPLQNAPSVFDKTTKLHAHSYCERCGRVTDVFLDEQKLFESLNDCGGARIQSVQLTIRGLCEGCAAQLNNQ